MISEEGRKWAFMLTKYTDTSYSACMSGMWKILRDKYPKKTPTLPSAKIDYQGRLGSEPNALTQLLGKEYGRVRLSPTEYRQKISYKTI